MSTTPPQRPCSLLPADPSRSPLLQAYQLFVQEVLRLDPSGAILSYKDMMDKQARAVPWHAHPVHIPCTSHAHPLSPARSTPVLTPPPCLPLAPLSDLPPSDRHAGRAHERAFQPQPVQ